MNHRPALVTPVRPPARKQSIKDSKTPLPSLAELEGVITTHFPDLWPVVRACVSVSATLLLADSDDPVVLILVGPASSSKTTVVSMFDQAAITYRSDRFTARSFVSHYAGTSQQELRKVDLLPRIKHKVLLTPELAPIFRGDERELTDTFSILARVLDGHGLTTDSGVHGQRGYKGDYLFAWLGATTPLSHETWKVMSQVGSRLFFIKIGGEQAAEDLTEVVYNKVPYRDRVEACRIAISHHLDALFRHFGRPRSVNWGRSADPEEIALRLADLATLVTFGRTLVIPSNESNGEFTAQPSESGYRAMSVLYNLARGHALLKGRKIIANEDLEVVIPIALSSMPTDRSSLLRCVLRTGGTLTVRQSAEELRVSQPTARKRLRELALLRIGAFADDPKDNGLGDHATQVFTLAERFSWMIQ